MKKLLLVILLLSFGSIANAQKQQFERTYSHIMFIDSEGVQSEWIELESRVLYNYGNNGSKIKMYLGNKVFNFTQQTATTKDKTVSGLEYYLLYIKDDETGENLYFQFFEDESYGVRVTDLAGRVMQLSN